VQSESNSRAEFIQTLEQKIILLLRKQTSFQSEIMLCDALFELFPTRWSLLMEEVALAWSGTLAVLLLNALLAGLLAILGLIILLPTYLLGLLSPALRKLALRLPNEFVPANWSDPAFFNSGGGRCGLPSGAQATDFILPFPNEQGSESSRSCKSTLGGDASIAAGPAAN
jgi:hypothetical protein